MFFAMLVLMSAFLIEGIGTYVSVVGLSSLFAANPVIIVLAIALDVGKVVSVSFLYKYWKKVNWLMKTYMTIAAMVLMMITSAGAFGYLSGQFQKAISSTNESSVVITALTEEQSRLQKRKEEIDAQVAKLPDNNVRGRTSLIKQFGPEVQRINDRLVAIDVELPKLKVETLKQNVEVGPIIYIAEAFNTTPEHAVKWVILTIIFVFDPLAIALLLSGNFLLEKKEEDAARLNSEEFIPHSEPNAPSIKSESPEQTDEVELHSHTISSAYPSVSGPYFVPSPTQAVTSWTSTTTYEEPAPEEAVEDEPATAPTPEEVVIEEPIQEEVDAVLSPEEIEQIERELEVAIDVTIDDVTTRDKEPDMVAILGDDHPDLEHLDTLASEIEDTLKDHDEREVIRLNSLMKPSKTPIHRSMLEDIPVGGDVMIDENQRRASGMHRNKYNDNTIVVGGPSDRV